MADREPPGYDDWFDDPEPPTVESGRGNRPSYDIPAETEEDVWVLPEDEERRGRRGGRGGRGGDIVIGGRSLTTTQVAILAIAALAIIIAILAAAGAFDGGTSGGMQTITTHTTTTTTTTTQTTPTVAAPTKQPLQLNDKGRQVKLLQKALTALGFNPGTPDGSFGPGTQSAVEQFQSAHGLAADGIVGKDTLTALKTAIRQQFGG
jgi:hypothetical protein